MTTQEELTTKLQSWVTSLEYIGLIHAYRNSHVNGTTGTLFQGKARPAVINEHGVLRPEKFPIYMMALQARIIGREPLADSGDYTLRLLESTLVQMFDSRNLGDGIEPETGLTLKSLFAKGKEMGSVLRELLNQKGVPPLQTVRGTGAGGTSSRGV